MLRGQVVRTYTARDHRLSGTRSIVPAMVLTIMLVGCGTPASPTQGAPTSTPPGATVSPTQGKVSFPPPEVTTIAIGTSAAVGNTFAPQLAVDREFYQKYGLESVEVQLLRGPAALQALIAGQVQFVRGGAEGVFFADGTDTELVSVASYYHGFLDDFFTAPDVQTADALRGKRVGVLQFGSVAANAAKVALEELGLSDEDVEFVEVGGRSDRLAALEAGTIAATTLGSELRDSLEAKGINSLVKLTDLNVDVVFDSLYTTRAFAEQNPNTVLAVVAANVEAQQFIFDDTEAAAALLAEWVQGDVAIQLGALEIYKKAALRDLRWTTTAIEGFQALLVEDDPSVADIDDLSRLYLTEFLDKLEAMGFFAELGVPGY